MTELTIQSDKTGALGKVLGSDGRMNVSSRYDTRAYYNSRDEGQCYAMVYDHTAAADGQYAFVLRNDHTTKEMVIESIGYNCTNIGLAKLWFVSGTLANGVAVVPANLNKSSTNDAVGTFLNDGGGTAITVGTVGSQLDQVQVAANGHEEFRIGDQLRLGQGDAIALEQDTGTSTPHVFGVVFFYYE
jgi:hypothetical protein